jgi:RHH-type transcriptional regulator, rel operon repressor / antitoxin RelB
MNRFLSDGHDLMSRRTATSLSDQVFDRLLALVARTGRTPESHIEEALKEHLEDLEDIDLAERALERRARGESRTYSLEEVGRELGLED